MHIGEAGFIDRQGITHFVESLLTSSRGRSMPFHRGAVIDMILFSGVLLFFEELFSSSRNFPLSGGDVIDMTFSSGPLIDR